MHPYPELIAIVDIASDGVEETDFYLRPDQLPALVAALNEYLPEPAPPPVEGAEGLRVDSHGVPRAWAGEAASPEGSDVRADARDIIAGLTGGYPLTAEQARAAEFVVALVERKQREAAAAFGREQAAKGMSMGPMR